MNYEGVRFLDYSHSSLYDSEGKEVFCACGEPAGSAIIGKSTSVALCTKCMYGSDNPPTAQFMYRPPNG